MALKRIFSFLKKGIPKKISTYQGLKRWTKNFLPPNEVKTLSGFFAYFRPQLRGSDSHLAYLNEANK